MSTLSGILSSRVRAEIFRLLFGLNEKELHMREMERQAALSLGTIRQDLQKLVKLDLVKARRDGNRLYCPLSAEEWVKWIRLRTIKFRMIYFFLITLWYDASHAQGCPR